MIEQSIKKLTYLIETIPDKLSAISDEEFSFKLNSSKWSKKEIIGHLIDSATNNHHRFVRGQFEENPEIIYDQNKWNECNFYSKIEREQIISFWTVYNKQILEIISRIPNKSLSKTVRNGDEFLTLEFIIVDYVRHLEHHLKQVVEY